VLAQVLAHAGVQPNPARDKQTVRLPREDRREVNPPTADHVEAVLRLLPRANRLPTLVLDATGMRVGELEALAWGDVDEPRCRWRRLATAPRRLCNGLVDVTAASHESTVTASVPQASAAQAEP
jgi:integrase